MEINSSKVAEPWPWIVFLDKLRNEFFRILFLFNGLNKICIDPVTAFTTVLIYAISFRSYLVRDEIKIYIVIHCLPSFDSFL